MAIKETLDKIVERHKDLIGAMVLSEGHIHHNLEAPYDVISAELILETLTEIFETTEMLADEGNDFGEVMIDFANHSLIARSIDNGVLAVLAPRLQRGQLVKLHIGLGVFAKAVQKALEETEVTEASTPEATPEPEQPAVVMPQAVKPPTEEELAAAESESKAREEGSEGGEFSLGRAFKRKRAAFRGSKGLIASRMMTDPVTDKADAAAADSGENVNEEGVPLNEDGTPKKKKMYRGQVYYE